MAFIRQASGSEKTLQIAGEEIFFPMTMGNNWGKIRVGLRCCLQGVSTMQDTANSSYNDWRCGVALCNGTTGFFHPAPVDVFAILAGASTYATSGAALTSAPFTLSNVFAGCTVAQKRGSLSLSSAYNNASGAMTLRCYAYSGVFYVPFYFDFDRVTTPGSIVVTVYGRTLAQIGTTPNTTFDNFMTGLATANPTGCTSLTASPTVAYAGNLNVFDTVSVFSNSTANNVLEVASLAVARLS